MIIEGRGFVSSYRGLFCVPSKECHDWTEEVNLGKKRGVRPILQQGTVSTRRAPEFHPKRKGAKNQKRRSASCPYKGGRTRLLRQDATARRTVGSKEGEKAQEIQKKKKGFHECCGSVIPSKNSTSAYGASGRRRRPIQERSATPIIVKRVRSLEKSRRSPPASRRKRKKLESEGVVEPSSLEVNWDFIEGKKGNCAQSSPRECPSNRGREESQNGMAFVEAYSGTKKEARCRPRGKKRHHVA